MKRGFHCPQPPPKSQRGSNLHKRGLTNDGDVELDNAEAYPNYDDVIMEDLSSQLPSNPNLLLPSKYVKPKFYNKSEKTYNKKYVAIKSQALLKTVLEDVDQKVGLNQVDKAIQYVKDVMNKAITKISQTDETINNDFEIAITHAIFDFFSKMRKYGVEHELQKHHLNTIATACFPLDKLNNRPFRCWFAFTFGIGARKLRKCIERRELFDTIVQQEIQSRALKEKNESENSKIVIDNPNVFLIDKNEKEDLKTETLKNPEPSLSASSSSSSLASLNEDMEDPKNVQESSGGISHATKPKQEKRINIFNCIDGLFKPEDKKKRSDYIPYSWVRDWCHTDSRFASIDTNLRNASKLIFDPDTESTIFHDVRVKHMTAEKAYSELFLNSEYYKTLRERHARKSSSNGITFMKKPTIGLSTFLDRVCPCCVEPTQRSCANVPIVELSNALKTAKFLLGLEIVKSAMDTCNCMFCKHPLSSQSFNGISNLKKLLLCEERTHEDLSYRPRSSISREAAYTQNEELAAKKISCEKSQSKGKLTNPHKPMRLPKSIKHSDFMGSFRIEQYKCTHWSCRECGGVDSFFDLDNECKIWLCNDHLQVKVALYKTVPRGNGVQKELSDERMSLREFHLHLYKTIKVGIPHKWDMDWNSQMERVGYRWAGEDEEVISVATDFGALVTATAQDSMNQAVPLRIIQDIVNIASLEKYYHTINGVDIPHYRFNDVHIW